MGSTICAAEVQVDYILDVKDRCYVLPYVIDADDTIFDWNDTLNIKVMEAEKTLSWTDDIVTSSPEWDCGPIEWEVTNRDTGFAIDPDVFTFDPSIPGIIAYTEDATKVDKYRLQVRISFPDYPDNPGDSKNFNINVEENDSCFVENIGITPSDAIEDIGYVVSRP